MSPGAVVSFLTSVFPILAPPVSQFCGSHSDNPHCHDTNLSTTQTAAATGTPPGGVPPVVVQKPEAGVAPSQPQVGTPKPTSDPDATPSPSASTSTFASTSAPAPAPTPTSLSSSSDEPLAQQTPTPNLTTTNTITPVGTPSSSSSTNGTDTTTDGRNIHVKNRTSTTIAAVLVPILVVSLAIAGVLLYKRWRRARDRREWERTHEEIADAVRDAENGTPGPVFGLGASGFGREKERDREKGGDIDPLVAGRYTPSPAPSY
ncbi:hypothetical protein FB45DRAFT_70541 [Roridomyces roridus]|uniref:Mid2 domain-containing protein n=1 Tax=Roridomyces roridus TaxID=1738132 RepID=A0AAD7BNC5_9AGAR|nr:hypothetical protein FB45DRAFT_70541 [Roridomyces roridus]